MYLINAVDDHDIVNQSDAPTTIPGPATIVAETMAQVQNDDVQTISKLLQQMRANLHSSYLLSEMYPNDRVPIIKRRRD